MLSCSPGLSSSSDPTDGRGRVNPDPYRQLPKTKHNGKKPNTSWTWRNAGMESKEVQSHSCTSKIGRDSQIPSV